MVSSCISLLLCCPLTGAGPELDQSMTSCWGRPPLKDPIVPKDDKIVFQQTDIDYYIGEWVLPASIWPAASEARIYKYEQERKHGKFVRLLAVHSNKKDGEKRISPRKVPCFASWNTLPFNFYRSFDYARIIYFPTIYAS